jgi:hypothetical protein
MMKEENVTLTQEQSDRLYELEAERIKAVTLDVNEARQSRENNDIARRKWQNHVGVMNVLNATQTIAIIALTLVIYFK